MNFKKEFRIQKDKRYLIHCLVMIIIFLLFIGFAVGNMIVSGLKGNFSYYPEFIEILILMVLGAYLSIAGLFQSYTFKSDKIVLRTFNGLKRTFSIGSPELTYYVSYQINKGHAHGIELQINKRTKENYNIEKKTTYAYFFRAEMEQSERIRQVFIDYILPLKNVNNLEMDNDLIKVLNNLFNESEKRIYGIEDFKTSEETDQIHTMATLVRKKKKQVVLATGITIPAVFSIIAGVFSYLAYLAKTGQIDAEYVDDTTPEMKTFTIVSFITICIVLPIVVSLIYWLYYKGLSDKDVIDLYKKHGGEDIV